MRSRHALFRTMELIRISSSFRRPRYVNDRRTQGDLLCNEAALRSSIAIFRSKPPHARRRAACVAFKKLHPEGKFGISARHD